VRIVLDRRRAVASASAICLLIGGCHSPPNLERVVVFARQPTPPTVVIVPPDVELAEFTFSGSVAARTDWNETAEDLAATMAQSILERKGVHAELWQPADAEAQVAEQAAARRQRDIARQLSAEPDPTGGSPFVIGARRWSIGTVADGLHQGTDARYALFVSLRDQYTSPERVVGQVAMGVLFVAAVVMLGVPLVPPPTLNSPYFQSPAGLQSASYSPSYGRRSRCPEQTGYASLVDLQNGDVVWFNHLWGGCSNLREPEDMHAALTLLLTGFP
jgi:hypothetical protein